MELLNTRFTPINLAETPAVAADGTIARPDVIPVAVAEQDGSASLPFYARYYATDAATAGSRYLRQLYGGLSVTPVHGPVQGPFIHPARRR